MHTQVREGPPSKGAWCESLYAGADILTSVPWCAQAEMHIYRFCLWPGCSFTLSPQPTPFHSFFKT